MDLRQRLDAWRDAGLITRDQAREIWSFERGRAAASGRVPLATEAVGYLGGALAIAGATAAFAETWDDLGVPARLTIAGALTLVTLALGWMLRGNPEPAFARFAASMWFVSAGCAGWFASLWMSDVIDAKEGIAAVAGAAMLVYGLVLYRLAPRAPQHLAAFVGAVLLVTDAAASRTTGNAEELAIGLSVWTLGVLWLALGNRRVLPPEPLAYALGSVAALWGALVMTFDSGGGGDLGLWLGVASSVALLAFSVALRDNVPLIFGSVGLFVFLVSMVSRYFGDTLGAPLVLLASGIILLLVAFTMMRLRSPRGGHHAHGPPATPA